MKKLTTLMTLMALTVSAFAVERERREPREPREPAPKAAPEKTCQEKRVETEKKCDKLGSGTLAKACKEAARHEERNCEAAKSTEQTKREPKEPREPRNRNA